MKDVGEAGAVGALPAVMDVIMNTLGDAPAKPNKCERKYARTRRECCLLSEKVPPRREQSHQRQRKYHHYR